MRELSLEKSGRAVVEASFYQPGGKKGLLLLFGQDWMVVLR